MRKFRVLVDQKAKSGSSLILIALQHSFIEACKWVAQIAIQSDCFSRVRLHHLAYRSTRSKFPELGSQLVSNAIYAVCRKVKGLERPSAADLRFNEFSPVFFDRHTLSVKQSVLSMLTLDGRIKFQVALSLQFLKLFEEGSLKEVQLIREGDQFFLLFCFKEAPLDQSIPEEVEQVA